MLFLQDRILCRVVRGQRSCWRLPRLHYVIPSLHNSHDLAEPRGLPVASDHRTVSTVQHASNHFHDERLKLLGCGLRSLLSCSARLPQGPNGAAARGGTPRARHGPVLCRPPCAAPAVSAGPLCSDLVGSLQQHASVIMDRPQGGTGQRTVWLCAGLKERGLARDWGWGISRYTANHFHFQHFSSQQLASALCCCMCVSKVVHTTAKKIWTAPT